MKRAGRAAGPDPFFTRASRPGGSAPAASTPGSTPRGGADWVVEAVVERLDVKQALFARVDAARGAAHDRHLEHLGHPDGRARRGPQRRLPPALPRHALLQPAALPEAARADPDAGDGRRRPGADRGDRRPAPRQGRRRGAGTRRISSATTSASTRSPGSSTCWAEGRFTIEEIDAMTGPAIGRPKSATFRTLDITGLDVLIHVARNLESRGRRRTGALPSPAAAGAGRSRSVAGSARRRARAFIAAREVPAASRRS